MHHLMQHSSSGGAIIFGFIGVGTNWSSLDSELLQQLQRQRSTSSLITAIHLIK